MQVLRCSLTTEICLESQIFCISVKGWFSMDSVHTLPWRRRSGSPPATCDPGAVSALWTFCPCSSATSHSPKLPSGYLPCLSCHQESQLHHPQSRICLWQPGIKIKKINNISTQKSDKYLSISWVVYSWLRTVIQWTWWRYKTDARSSFLRTSKVWNFMKGTILKKWGTCEAPG